MSVDKSCARLKICPFVVDVQHGALKALKPATQIDTGLHGAIWESSLRKPAAKRRMPM